MQQNPTDDKSRLFRRLGVVMQQTITWVIVDAELDMTSLGHNELIEAFVEHMHTYA